MSEVIMRSGEVELYPTFPSRSAGATDGISQGYKSHRGRPMAVGKVVSALVAVLESGAGEVSLEWRPQRSWVGWVILDLEHPMRQIIGPNLTSMDIESPLEDIWSPCQRWPIFRGRWVHE